MKTAVEWLMGYINHLNENGYDFRPKYDENIVEKANKMFEEQIRKSYCDGELHFASKQIRTSEQYYNETFKSE